jgi:hypothetical protein
VATYGSKDMKRFLLGTIVAGTVLAGSAQATTFTFSDEYYVTNLATFHNLFGATTTGYGTSGRLELPSFEDGLG